MRKFTASSARAGDLTLLPTVVKTDLFGPESEQYRLEGELGRLVVPERRADPQSNLIELTFVRLKSTAQQPGPPLVFLAGGPGVSGAESVRWDGSLAWFNALREVGDVIALDQRGTGLSLPNLDCLERWDIPLDQPGSREDYLRIGLERCRSSARYWRSHGVDLAGYTSVESADDIDALRQALGVEQLNLYGASYGSHLALATIRRHGAHISHAIVGLVEGPDHTIKLPSNIQRHLEKLAGMVSADARLNEKIPDFLALMRSVLERLEREPVTVQVRDKQTGKDLTVGIGKFDLQLLTAGGMGSRRFLSKLPARYYAMSQGDFSWLAEQVLARRREWIGSAMAYMMDCASGLSPERLTRIKQEAPQTLVEDLIDFPFPAICAAWDAPDLGPDYRAPLSSQVPLLAISGTLDGRTPISNAEEVLMGFPHGQHLIVEGAGHSTPELVSLPEIRQAMVAFLQDKPIGHVNASLPFEFTPIEAI